MAYLADFFHPRSVAIIGASRTPGKVGYAILRNVRTTFPGKIYPINPNVREIEGLRCYPDIGEVRADLALIVVPSRIVPEVAEQCGASGVRYIIVVSAGFREVGKEGLALEKSLVETCRRYGMRMLGPNCVGMIDTSVPLNATFAPKMPLAGSIGFMSQSGALCTGILDWSLQEGIGFSKFVSLGNKPDINEADVMEALSADPNTRVILGYIEDVVSGEQFLEVAQRAARRTPIVILKAGTSEAGARAVSSHTGALAGSDSAYDAAFKQCGIIRARSVGELFDLAKAFATQPSPHGRKVAIVTNAGGLGIVTSDAVEARGLEMARLTPKTADTLRRNLPPEATVYNPVDVLGDATGERYAFALREVLADEEVDSLLALLAPQAITRPTEAAQAIAEASAAGRDKPVLSIFLGGKDVREGAELLWKHGLPCFQFPEQGVAALAGLVAHAEFLQRPRPADCAVLDADREKVARIVDRARRDGRTVLLGVEGAQVMTAYGIPVPPFKLTTQPDEATDFAEEVGYPVVLKVASPGIIHKTDVGGVRLDLRTREAVTKAYVEIMENVHRYMPHTRVYGIQVQKMMPQGRELIVGVSRDIQFGPLVMFGSGGIYVNLFRDVSFRLAQDLSPAEIESMLRETKAYTLLRGIRGEKPADVRAVIETIRRVARLSLDFQEISELDINPLFAYEDGCLALDVKITIS